VAFVGLTDSDYDNTVSYDISCVAFVGLTDTDYDKTVSFGIFCVAFVGLTDTDYDNTVSFDISLTMVSVNVTHSSGIPQKCVFVPVMRAGTHCLNVARYTCTHVRSLGRSQKE
jgi:dUTPase